MPEFLQKGSYMNIRKIVLFILCATIVAGAEEKLNIFGAAGFGFGTGGKLIQSITKNGLTTADKEDHYFNYGQGLKLDLGIQYYMMENLALQVGFGMSGRVPRLATENNLILPASSINIEETYKSSLFGVKVMVVPRFEVLELTNMYAGIGVGFFWNSLRYETDSIMTVGTITTTATETGKYISSPKLGLLGLLGIDYPLSDVLCAFG
jgi:opacity protein-like surface antigen